MNIKELGEFGFIESIKNKFSDITLNNIEGIGDDCAIIEIDKETSFVVSTDMLIENIHFIREKITPYKLGRKSLAVNLSDIAAMGAEPFATLLSIALPKDIEKSWCEEFLNGYHSLSKEHTVMLIGGDTTASISDIAINVTVIGKAQNKNIRRRNCAKTGDLIAVTNYLGDSATGLNLILNNIKTDGYDQQYLIEQHNNPSPKIAQGKWLASQKGVHAMMDISDGIASDLMHICTSSNMSAEVYLENIPQSDSLINVCKKHNWSATNMSLCSGEDYCLLLTIDGDFPGDIIDKYREVFKTDLFIIGKITPSVGDKSTIKYIDKNGDSVDINNGFRHF